MTVVDELIAQCESYHIACDMLFAMLIEATKDQRPCFYPSKSGHPWSACIQGRSLVERVRASEQLSTLDIRTWIENVKDRKLAHVEPGVIEEVVKAWEIYRRTMKMEAGAGIEPARSGI